MKRYLKNNFKAIVNLFQAIVRRKATPTSNAYVVCIFYYGDILLNTLCAGNWKVTVSARTGYYALNSNRARQMWKFAQWIIDETFRPIDGERHCYQAYRWTVEKICNVTPDKEHTVFEEGPALLLIVLMLFIVLMCVIIAPIIWVLSKAVKGSKMLG